MHLRSKNRLWILLIAFCFLGEFHSSALSSSPQTSWQKEIQEIDREIAKLEELKEKYEASIDKNTNNAMRWQFQNENYMDARKAWDQVEKDKQTVKEIQQKIDMLEAQKAEILKEHS